jgi:hypothetical protein
MKYRAVTIAIAVMVGGAMVQVADPLSSSIFLFACKCTEILTLISAGNFAVNGGGRAEMPWHLRLASV